MSARLALLAVAATVLVAADPAGSSARPFPQSPHDVRVVVATLDTGVNPLHPTFRRDGATAHPSTYLEGYPTDAPAAELTLTDSFDDDLLDSEDGLDAFATGFAWVPGTQIIGAWSHPDDVDPVFTGPNGTQYHGGPAASQIAGRGYGFSEDTLLVVMDRTAQGSSTSAYEVNAMGLRWAADQPWIDVIHTNIQSPFPWHGHAVAEGRPVSTEDVDAVRYALERGKVVVSAAGNFWALPAETSPHTALPGVLVVGANDNCGGPTDYTNLHPDVVSDGYATPAADPDGYGEVQFGGTSSASPRVAGYVAELVLRVRREVGHLGGIRDGALVVVPEAQRPEAGPLADGRLTADEVHRVVRHTADPAGHPSRFDGGSGICIPAPGAETGAWWSKLGYGEVSEHTIDVAVDVVLGRVEEPARPVEDGHRDRSLLLRSVLWG